MRTLFQQAHRIDQHVQPLSLFVSTDEDQPLSVAGCSTRAVIGDSDPVEQHVVNIEVQVLSDELRRVRGNRNRHVEPVQQTTKRRTEIAVAG
jgi:hypothetical protein